MIQAAALPSRFRVSFTVDEYEEMVRTAILTENHPVELIRGQIVRKNTNGVRYQFSEEEYEELIKQGILHEGDRVELANGEIVKKTSTNPPHSSCIKKASRRLLPALGDRATVGIQDPVRLPDSEPEPDISVLRFRDDNYSTAHPTVKDILLLVEVADSSLAYDRDVKGSMYAAAKVAEYWISNLVDDCLEVYRSPQSDGIYGEKLILHNGEKVRMLAFPDIEFDVADFI